MGRRVAANVNSGPMSAGSTRITRELLDDESSMTRSAVTSSKDVTTITA
ncbi:hypothetical protein ACWEV4_33160 [Streptomyces sp. NPDC003860]